MATLATIHKYYRYLNDCHVDWIKVDKDIDFERGRAIRLLADKYGEERAIQDWSWLTVWRADRNWSARNPGGNLCDADNLPAVYWRPGDKVIDVLTGKKKLSKQHKNTLDKHKHN
jgi:hypothetical protein